MANRKRKPRTKKMKIRKWLETQLHAKYTTGHGMVKHAIKDEHNSTPYIHSDQTYKTYLSQCRHFADWLTKEKGVNDKEKAWELIPEYLKYLEENGKSAWTISTAMNAIAKAYGVSTTEIAYEAPKRERTTVKRSRKNAVRDEHFSEENNKELVTLAKCSGLRRHEIEALLGSDLKKDKDGNWIIRVQKGKGGKFRTVILHGSGEEINCVIKIMQNAGKGLVFPEGVHSACDVHYYRGVYACRAYASKAREVIPDKDQYHGRKDKKDIVYDKKAMLYASQQLGHNRIDVIASSYLYNL